MLYQLKLSNILAVIKLAPSPGLVGFFGGLVLYVVSPKFEGISGQTWYGGF